MVLHLTGERSTNLLDMPNSSYSHNIVDGNINSRFLLLIIWEFVQKLIVNIHKLNICCTLFLTSSLHCSPEVVVSDAAMYGR